MTEPPLNTVAGCILGAAAGDALGLAAEGTSARRQARMFNDPGRYHFLFGRGMVSDDTEHAAITAQALIVSGGDPDRFGRALAWRLRFWLAMLPAGIGLATLRALVKLSIGFPAHYSGVFSAGNGPAMRAPIIGAAYGHERALMRKLIRVSTRITHTDPKAEAGALAVAIAAHLAGQSAGKPDPARFVSELQSELAAAGIAGDGLSELIGKAAVSAERGETAAVFAQKLGLGRGVTGYMYHTVPAVIHCWFRHGSNLREGLIEIIRLGGDTDTTAAILGGIMGAGAGREGIPEDWLSNLWEWPRTVAWMEALGEALHQSAVLGQDVTPPPYAWWGILPRNLFFMAVVLLHGFRRLLPPY